MHKHPLARLVVVAVLVVAGLWLALRSGAPAAETSARQAALSAFAPGRPLAPSSSTDPVPTSGTVSPVTVDLATVPTGVDPENHLYARWQRGEVDLTATESILPPAEIAALQEAAMALPPMPSASVPSSPSSPTPGNGWASLDYNGNNFVPPDPELAAGPNHLIAAVNSSFQIYNKSGTSVGGPYDFAAFMSVVPACNDFAFDPNAIYDEAADRFILGIDVDGEYYCLAVSATSNPVGSWYVYAFPTGSASLFFDYPHAGVGHEYIFVGANMFTSGFLESRVYAFDKSDMYAGSTAAWAMRPLPVTEDTPIPLHLHGWGDGTWNTGPDHYFITDYNFNGQTYRVWRWTNPLSSAPVAVGVVNLATYTGVAGGMPINAPQSGTTARLQANDFRPHDFEYRNGYGWMAHTFACNPGSGTVNCLRWAKINPVNATIADAGVLATNGQHRIFPNLAVNRCDDMVMGYTKTSSSMYPGVFATGREAGDPAGTLQTEVQLKAGEIDYTAFDGSPHRWGDYTGMTIDPDGETFWYLGEYSKITNNPQGRWGTYINSLSFDCDPLPETGTIVIVKEATPADDTPFSFTENITPGTFTLTDPSDNTETFTNVAAGTYTVTEDGETGWTLDNIDCDDANSTGNTGTGAATINLEAGETVTCTFENSEDPGPGMGTIVIVKEATPADDTPFSFTETVSITGTFTLMDPSDNTETFTNVAAGTYTVTEDGETGWTLDEIDCDDANSTGNTGTGAATINLEAGETVTCTFSNEMDQPVTADIFVSSYSSGTTDDNVAYGLEDILLWDSGNWSMWFDGEDADLKPNGGAKHNINAFWIPDPNDDDVLMSFTQNGRYVNAIPGKVDGMDLVMWDGQGWSLVFDGQDVGLTVLTKEKIDALHVLDDSAAPPALLAAAGGSCLRYMLISTAGDGKVPGYDGAVIKFDGTDVLGFCQTAEGPTTAGKWIRVLNGKAEGLPGQALTSLSASPDGEVLYLTTKKAINVDGITGGHSMIYAYDFATGDFSGPYWSAPAEGMNTQVDGLQVEALPMP